MTEEQIDAYEEGHAGTRRMNEAKSERIGRELFTSLHPDLDFDRHSRERQEQYCAAAEAIYRAGYDAATLGMEC